MTRTTDASVLNFDPKKTSGLLGLTGFRLTGQLVFFIKCFMLSHAVKSHVFFTHINVTLSIYSIFLSNNKDYDYKAARVMRHHFD